ncbi:MAG: AMP-binding protein [Alistipes sp.]|nr:AMP-binding protein [Candidatus Alistipes equi]
MLQENLIKLYEQSFRNNREMSALTDYHSGETYSYYGLAKEIAKLHILMENAGVKPKDRIALVGRNTPRWCIVYLATITYGAVIVPILQDFTPTDITHIVNHSESTLMFLTDSFWDSLDEEAMPEVRAFLSLTDYHVIYERGNYDITDCINNMTANYRKRYPQGFTINNITYRDVPNDEVILLNYTSGTTGYSKGVMLTVNNLTGNILFATSYANKNGYHYYHKGMRMLSFLPLAHAYGCTFDMLTPLVIGGHVTLLGRIPTPKILIEAMHYVRPTVICSVPLILEKVYRKQILPMLSKGPLSIAMKVPLLNVALYSTIRTKLIEAFGEELELFIVGGAPMNQETEQFLHKIHFPLTTGYGLTECGPLVSFADWQEFKLGSCGKYLKRHIECVIDSYNPQHVPGELLIRGEHVMKGYYKNPKDTDAVFDENGWFHTGDMATMDDDGTLYIKGRCKTMILTSSGQNIYPEQIEDKLNNLPLVLESLVVEHDGKLYGLVVPDFEQIERLHIDNATLKEHMNENLKLLNEQVASYEKLVAISLHMSEFEKTPKRSIKRYLYQGKHLIG